MISAHVDSFVRDRLPSAEAQPEFLFDRPELQYPDRLNAAVELIGRADPETLAILNDKGAWTCGEMDDLSDLIARLLVDQEGLVPGNRVLLRGPNNAMLFASWLGVLKAGGVVVATMPILRAGEIETIIERAEISHSIIDARCLEDYRPAHEKTGKIRSLLTYEGDAGTGDLEAKLKSVAPGFKAVETHRDDPALIAFTSGTTGKPKGCVHYHRDILASADAFAGNILKPLPGDRWACSAPIAFTFGLGQALIFPWRFGGTAVTIETPNPAALLDAVRRHKVTILATAPTAYKAMLGFIEDRDVAHLRVCVSAGEHLPAATWHDWKEATGISIVDGIGATEMMHIFISASGEDIRPGATGKAVPGYRACVVDDDGQILPPPADGRLAVKGPTGCRYFDDERQSAYVQKGWNLTGDTYRQDGEGYFWYLARSDDMIISSGYNIAAPEVENALYTHPSVQECAVIGIQCEERGQKVKAYVVASVPVSETELQDHVKKAIAPYKYPREIEFVDALPRTATGKLQRYALRDGQAR
ncbi:MAG: AMP-binding protein [Sphingosinicella sp.]|nr:AMP-binding protein [Sphingosinicella sp.]